MRYSGTSKEPDLTTLMRRLPELVGNMSMR
jgi:hypothetical protein